MSKLAIHKLSTLLLLLLIASICNGCFLWTTKTDGDELIQEMASMRLRMKTIEGDALKEQHRLSKMIAHAQIEVENLEETLVKATRILARNSADFGADLETIKETMMATEGKHAETGHSIELLQKELENSKKHIREFALAAGLDLPVNEKSVPKEAREHFNIIKNSLRANRYGETRSLAKLFIKRYPKNKKCPQVQLSICQSYIDQKRWAKSLGALRKFTDNYPKNKLMPNVLYEMANAFFNLGDCTDARILVETVTSRYKKSLFAKKSEKLMQTMNTQKSKCTS